MRIVLSTLVAATLSLAVVATTGGGAAAGGPTLPAPKPSGSSSPTPAVLNGVPGCC